LSVIIGLKAAYAAESKHLVLVHTHENREFGQLLTAFTEQTGITLDIIWMDQADLKSRIINIGQLEQVPDMIIAPSDNIGLKDYGLFSDVPKELIASDLLPESLATVTLNNQQFGVPIIHGNHLLLYYNKKLVQHPPSSWKQLVDYRSKLPSSVELIGWSFMEMYWFVPFITAFGEPPLIDNQPNLNTKAVQRALTFVWQEAQEGVVNSECSYACVVKKFQQQQLAFTINGIWAYKQFKRSLGDSLGIAQLPKIEGKPMRSYSSSIVAMFPKHSLTGRNQESLRKLLLFLQSPEFQRSLWYRLNELPALQTAFDDIKQQTDSDIEQLLLTLETTLPLSSHKNMSVVWEALLKGYTRFGSGAWDAERATAYMQRIAERASTSDTGND
jgi:maltose-binding protein MalE